MHVHGPEVLARAAAGLPWSASPALTSSGATEPVPSGEDASVPLHGARTVPARGRAASARPPLPGAGGAHRSALRCRIHPPCGLEPNVLATPVHLPPSADAVLGAAARRGQRAAPPCARRGLHRCGMAASMQGAGAASAAPGGSVRGRGGESSAGQRATPYSAQLGGGIGGLAGRSSRHSGRPDWLGLTSSLASVTRCSNAMTVWSLCRQRTAGRSRTRPAPRVARTRFVAPSTGRFPAPIATSRRAQTHLKLL